ncbi:hypothetical protein [Cesiribacter sp. SM1]|uniref:hypothetical protein n=1 Tax=Cesiribacter sp. SM1 TaxID=2861196 RepID=UPI001CD2DED7|nr:hypothetical protein [Cesiribacter sp. SM1]
MQANTLIADVDFQRILHIGEVAFSYYQVQRSSPSEQDYEGWLNSLPEIISRQYQLLGYERGKHSIDFRRYFMAIRQQDMFNYMEENLSREDFKLWLERKDQPANLW